LRTATTSFSFSVMGQREGARERELDVPLVVDEEHRGGHERMLQRRVARRRTVSPGWRRKKTL
jgi:hypothetical protein